MESDVIFKPRRFRAKKDLFGLSDGGVASFTFTAQYVEKGKIYEESDPRYLQGNKRNIVIDDDSNWWRIGTSEFDDLFEEVHD